jgi:hypothetical protein
MLDFLVNPLKIRGSIYFGNRGGDVIAETFDHLHLEGLSLLFLEGQHCIHV